MKATEQYFRILLQKDVRFFSIFFTQFLWKIGTQMIMSWWVTANFFPVYIGFHRNCASGWDLRRSHCKCSPFTQRCCSESIAWDNLWVKSYVIVSTAIFTLYRIAFRDAAIRYNVQRHGAVQVVRTHQGQTSCCRNSSPRFRLSVFQSSRSLIRDLIDYE